MSDNYPDGQGDDLRLRAKPPKVLRLSRRNLGVLSALVMAAIAATVALAIRARPKPDDDNLKVVAAAAPPEALQALPRDYRGPRLGPPLPGDLGRPIVAADAARASGAHAPQVERVAEQRQANLELARRSGLFLGEGRATRSSTPLEAPAPLGALPMQGEATAVRDDAAPGRLRAPASPFVIQAGAVVPAALLTGVRSDLPGQVVAQITQPVYDTPTGAILLIPQGSRLLGEYDSRVGFGQRRLHLVWTRLVLPNGRWTDLGREPAGDSQGYAGLQDHVDRRWRDLFGMAALSTLLAVGAEAGANDETDWVQALRRGAGEAFNQVGEKAVGQALAIPPSLTIRPGAPVRLIVTRDLVLEPFVESWP